MKKVTASVDDSDAVELPVWDHSSFALLWSLKLDQLVWTDDTWKREELLLET